ncbi:glutamate 5-kinase [Candidatus Sumerlaeota bacterium]|nr:glutamate 5-kinase [Candidatus Sumerlaeota bacterium]
MSDDILQAAWPFRDAPLRRVVVKVGSNVLAREKGGLNQARIAALCDSLAALQGKGVEVILVSSGAVAAGRGILKLDKRPANIPDLQAVAAVGQGALMEEYGHHFRRHGIVPAQLLLTRDDLADKRRYINVRLAMLSLLKRNVIPIVNENDSVTIEELKFGDNDMLSAMVAAKMEADLLVIMSNVPGLMTGHPKYKPDAALIPVVKKIDASVEALVHSEGSEFGVGGMQTKLMAAKHATNFGVHTLLVNGNEEGVLSGLTEGRVCGTLFTTQRRRRSRQRHIHWIGAARPHGTLIVDEGAARALLAHKSLLPIGVRMVNGDFSKGDVVAVMSEKEQILAQGITNYDAPTLEKICGRKRDEIVRILGAEDYAEAIHCDNLVMLPGGDA